MKKEEFIARIGNLKQRIGQWRVEIDKELYADYIMGCFYDGNQKLWKVYVNNERGRHKIRLETAKEEEAFAELFSIVNFEVENNKYVDF